MSEMYQGGFFPKVNLFIVESISATNKNDYQRFDLAIIFSMLITIWVTYCTINDVIKNYSNISHEW